MPTKLNSVQEPCSKCLKKYGSDLIRWNPCSNCPWITKENKSKDNLTGKEKQCLECQEILNFLEPEKGKYLCGKNKCLRTYIEKKSESERLTKKEE